MKYTDTQLKKALTKMLPAKLAYVDTFYWRDEDGTVGREAIDTELYHICWLVEQHLTDNDAIHYMINFACAPNFGPAMPYMRSTWQQRTACLAKVAGVEI